MSNSKTLFTPPQAALDSVGLSVADLGTDEQIYDLIASCTQTMRAVEARIAVAVYTLFKRGATIEKMAQRMGVTFNTVERRIAEGMAILRTGDADRSIAAVRTAGLKVTQVDDLTRGAGTANGKLIKLEQGALSTAIKARYKDGAGATPDTAKFVDVLLPQLQQAAKADSVPPTMDELIHYVPAFSENLGLEKIQRSPGTPSNDGPYALAFHLKKALDDVKALEKASDGLPYEATNDDVVALLKIMALPSVASKLNDALDAAKAAESKKPKAPTTAKA